MVGSGGPACKNKAAAPWGMCVSSGSLLLRFLVSNHTFHASKGLPGGAGEEGTKS